MHQKNVLRIYLAALALLYVRSDFLKNLATHQNGTIFNRGLLQKPTKSLHCHKQKCGIVCSDKKFNGEKMCMPSSMCSKSEACLRDPNFGETVVKWNWGRPGRIAVLIFGQSARPAQRMSSNICLESGRKAQFKAIATQRAVFESLIAKEPKLTVDIFLSTNPCKDKKEKGRGKTGRASSMAGKSSNWVKEIRHAYGPHLRKSSIINCDEKKKNVQRCYLRRVLTMFNDHWKSLASSRGKQCGGVKGPCEYSFVVFLRPDISFTGERGSNLVHDLLADRYSSTWPFKCEHLAWISWKCVADTVFAVAANQMNLFRDECLGADGCYAELAEDGGNSGNVSGIHTLHNRSTSKELNGPIELRLSGHSCYRCLQEVIHKSRAKTGESTQRTFNAPKIIRAEERRVNARDEHNPYYFFAGADL